ncbi:MAG TPA: HD domain-containing phosphohydrolase [Tepidisphaeraceae bacterium]|nr:HD domain-containing phosphohydrolase [Tepidisphaeraceae bacterium]
MRNNNPSRTFPIRSARIDDDAIYSLARRAEQRDCSTEGHLHRVRVVSRLLAEALRDAGGHPQVDDAFIGLLQATSVLHDIGKHAVLDRVLLKPGRLDADEFRLMRLHALAGARTLRSLSGRAHDDPWLVMATEIALTHHEKWDGTGYPRGLAGESIPLPGRIVALADVYDALTSARVYKPAFDHEVAREMILEQRGRHFDPAIVDAFCAIEAAIVVETTMTPHMRLAA